ncbi:MAG: transposase [Moorea sp. SIO2B7]|nr:transposase [Moorena sp. SIO2B7]
MKIRENVKEVSVDMWGRFPKVIQAIFPNAQIVIERFQVMKLVNTSLNKILLLLGFKGLENRTILLKYKAYLIEEDWL